MLLLAKFLDQHGYGPFDYMLGERLGHSHAWLRREQDGLIVDITGDQFADMPQPVFVGYASPWHDGFEGTALHVADFDIYGERVGQLLGGAYERVCQHLEDGQLPMAGGRA